MPNLNSYLKDIASKLIIRDSEKEKIKVSADSIKTIYKKNTKIPYKKLSKKQMMLM